MSVLPADTNVDRLGRAVLAHVFNGQRADLSRISSALFSPDIAAVWRRAKDLAEVDGAVDPLALLGAQDIDTKYVGSLIGHEDAVWVQSATHGVELLTDIVNQRHALKLADDARAALLAGRGIAEAEALLRWVQSTSKTAPSALPTPLDLTEWRKAEEPDWLLVGFIVRRAVALLSAAAKTGKSLTLLDLLIRVAAGATGRWLDWIDLPGKPIRCLLIDLENGEARIKNRIRSLVQGGGILHEEADAAMQNLIVVPRPKNVSSIVASGELARWIDGFGAELVVADPLRPFLPGDADENDAGAVGGLIDQFRSAIWDAGASAIIVDHDNLAGRAGRGSSAKGDAVDFVYHLTRPRKDDPDFLELEVERDRDPIPVRKVTFRRVRKPGGVAFESEGVVSLDVADPILAALRFGARSQAQLETDTKLSRSTLQRKLKVLTDAHVIRRVGETPKNSPMYELTDPPLSGARGAHVVPGQFGQERGEGRTTGEEV